jgi:ankyrin repeat protein
VLIFALRATFREEASKEVVKLLLEKGADINAQDQVLLFSVLLVHVFVAICAPASRHLYCFSCDKASADLSFVAQDGRSALMFALQTGASKDVMDFLLENGADIDAHDKVAPFPCLV